MQREYGKYGFYSFSAGRNRELRCLRPGESGINMGGRILEVSQGALQATEADTKNIVQGIIADEIAKLPFVSGEDREALVKNAVVQIDNASVKRRNGLPTLYIGNGTNVHVIEGDGGFPSSAALQKPKKRTIGDVVGCEGAFDVIVEGTIVSITAEQDTRTVVLDDGTGAIFLVLRDKEKEAHISFGMAVKARGNVVAAENGYAVMAEDVRISSEAFVITEMKKFLCKYT
jgi:ssDNA-binding replication factor A large subunit